MTTPLATVLPATAAPATTVAIVLAQEGDNGGGGKGEDFGKSSPVGLLLLIVFLIAVAFLIRSMTKHLKRIPASFDGADSADTEQGDDAQEAEATDNAEAAANGADSGADRSDSADPDADTGGSGTDTGGKGRSEASLAVPLRHHDE